MNRAKMTISRLFGATCRKAGALYRLLTNHLRSLEVKRIDRYIITKFLSTYIFLIAIVILIAIIFDYNEKIDKFTQSHASAQKIILDYYLSFIPYFINLFSPLFVLGEVIEHSWGQRVIRFYDLDGHIIEVGEDMKMVIKRFLDSGMTMEEVSVKMDASIEDLTKS